MKWIVKETQDLDLLQKIMKELNVSRVIASALLNRGICSFEEARYFFRAGWSDLHDPFLMKDMDSAVSRVIKAIENKETIFIYGDYDVDGITSASMLFIFFRKLGLEVHYYIPDRLKEGYGISETGIEQALAKNADLLISVDCGITAVKEAAYAKKMGLDVIISDHHEPAAKLPDAVAILDPKRTDDEYPFKELAGVGVAFKLIQAVCRRMNYSEETAQDFLDLVALGSVADIVPLTGENRILVSLGLERISRHERLGLRALAESCGLMGKSIGTGQVVFIMAPRINAAGRMGNAERAVNLLVSEDNDEARKIADVLEKENCIRKNVDEETFHEATQMLPDTLTEEDAAIVLAKEGWHSGVIGIVASRVAEKVNRPTIMIAVEDGIGKGSARSISNFDIYEALKKCEYLLSAFGGHKYAAGLTVETSNIPEFALQFRKIAAESLTAEDFEPILSIDAEIGLPEINAKLIRVLNQFAPFGPLNMRPVFMSRNVQVIGSPRIVGNNHLKFRVRQKGSVFDAIGFDLGSLAYRLAPGENNLDMVYVIEENIWNGTNRIQLRVKDLR